MARLQSIERSLRRTSPRYIDGSMRVQTIQAYARGWKERLVIQKILKRRRAFWGAVVWTFRAMRFKRDRLAAFTLQCTVRDPLQRDRRRGKQFDSVARTCRRVLEATRSKALEDILLPPSIGLGCKFVITSCVDTGQKGLRCDGLPGPRRSAS